MTLDLQTRIKAKIREIESAIELTPYQDRPLSLLAGAGGSILYHFYMAKMQDSGVLYDRAFALLNTTLDYLEEHGIDALTYTNGIVGFGRLFHLLAEEGYIETEVDDILVDVDDVVIAYTHRLLAEGNLDFLHGAIGNGFYLNRRVGRPAIDECLGYFVGQLRQTAICDEQGVRWYEQPSEKNRQSTTTVNLSLSHGLCSKIVFLAECLKNRISVPECTFLLEGCLQYLQQYHQPDSEVDTYPSFVADPGQRQYFHRLAWCYGDLGVAVALISAGKALGKPQWVEQAVGVALRAAKRRTPDKTALVDVEFCHGTAGVAHIFNRFYLESGNDEFRAVRDHWLEQTLAMASFPDGLAGYKTWRGGSWLTDVGLLEGIMGVGLVLQSSLEKAPDNLSWDGVLLLDWR
ncbi:hypothetical protein E5K00_10045 [Hymenobacter aquaticus]|uniref:Lanthionine synthetase n=1 Tax=Hymenobacter aquaticus TaxID=1867101 RepID=A0A4Z0Q7W4_9BACT|nr:lanthionine synthetase C family protein [Hymenobacter aquaticus]TGE25509.1 hypothetical protein E5K00_10045 [Hymenobacter aquaticus]